MKKILFTGARSGIINRVIDNILNDYYIYLTVHTESELKIVKEKYKKYNNVECFKLDVLSKSDQKKISDLDIDIFVSNAAMGESGSMEEIDMDKVRTNFEVNVFANFEIVQIVLKKMIAKGRGKIIMISSLAGILPIPFLGSYCASKASIIKMTEALNLEMKLLDCKIDVCLIEPGLYKTGFNKLMFDKKYEWMDINSYFNRQIDIIRKSENIVLYLFERKSLNSIVKKIIKAIKKDNPNFIYRAPFLQSLGVKIYYLFN
ncbi:MAG: SDR family NAD(P)-dependent oxidoreductase [Bacilli bacterium]|nr:SDR family NAD(P)-dependent oxidoreductase [Bacilli bacterium]